MNPGSVSLGMSAAGAVAGAIGGFYSAKSAKANLRFQAAMADINARLAETSAQQELARGQHEVGRLTMEAGRVKAAQRVAQAANGVDLGEGSAAEVRASTDILKEIDKNTLEANAVRSAWGYRTQGANYQAEAISRRGAASGINPMMAGVSSLLGRAGSVADKWIDLKNAGAIR